MWRDLFYLVVFGPLFGLLFAICRVIDLEYARSKFGRRPVDYGPVFFESHVMPTAGRSGMACSSVGHEHSGCDE